MDKISLLVDRLEKARSWTRNLLEDIEESRWFDMPAPGIGHVAWQVGHIAASEIALIPVRCTGAEFTEFAPDWFREKFGRGSTPLPSPAAYPTIPAIRADFTRIHDRCLELVRAIDKKTLKQPTIGGPHPMFDSKEGAIAMAAMHEAFHAGQIAMLRRLQGKAPLR